MSEPAHAGSGDKTKIYHPKTMKHLKEALISAAIIFSTSSAGAWNIAEFYYTLDSTTIEPIAPGYNPVLIHTGPISRPSNGRAYFNAVNIANNSVGSTFMQFSPDIWSGAQWTGLEPNDRSSQAQAGLSYNGAFPSYGNNVFQIDGGRVGMFLNTYNLAPPNPYLTSAQQFQRFFTPARRIWNQGDTTSSLCVNGQIDLHSWEGGSSQAMMTFGIDEVGTDRFFFLNIMMLDTNPNNTMSEGVMNDNPLDTGAPIAHTFFQSQNASNLLSRYSSPISGYGQILEAYTKTPSKSASMTPSPKHYGACIDRSQFSRILQDIRVSRPQFSGDPSAYGISAAHWGPEIAGPGIVGMSIHAANIFRITP